MSGLVLKLGPQERIMINGVVMENGERKAALTIKTPGAAVLRLRDALHPDDVGSPVTRAYYTAQMVVAGEADETNAVSELKSQLDALMGVFEGTTHIEPLMEAQRRFRERNFYYVMRSLRPLIEVERSMLGGAAQGKAPQPSVH